MFILSCKILRTAKRISNLLKALEGERENYFTFRKPLNGL